MEIIIISREIGTMGLGITTRVDIRENKAISQGHMFDMEMMIKEEERSRRKSGSKDIKKKRTRSFLKM